MPAVRLSTASRSLHLLLEEQQNQTSSQIVKSCILFDFPSTRIVEPLHTIKFGRRSTRLTVKNVPLLTSFNTTICLDFHLAQVVSVRFCSYLIRLKELKCCTLSTLLFIGRNGIHNRLRWLFFRPKRQVVCMSSAFAQRFSSNVAVKADGRSTMFTS